MTRPSRSSSPHPLDCSCSRCDRAFRRRDSRGVIALFLLSFVVTLLLVGWALKQAFSL